jgi:DNA-binding response OmpR family regulator
VPYVTNRLSFDTAEVLLYDPVTANRMATRATLFAVGFRHVETATTLKAFQERIRVRPPDLVLCEIDSSDTGLCEVIQSLRQGQLGYNPFVVIIATTWEKSAALVKGVVDSGADDLLLRPFSTAQLTSRIETHIQRRKGFVVTTDYVGPDRRNDQSRPSTVELFEPPNSLRMKAKERLSRDQTAHRLDVELQAARELLNSEKLRRDAFQVCVLWRMIHAQGQSCDDELDKIERLVRAMVRRCRDGDLELALGWCDSILAAVEGLLLGVDRNASMHLLGHAALNLNRVFRPDVAAQEQLAEIDTMVANIRAREASRKLAS